MLRHVDLCSGIGGFALGFERAGLSSPVMFCDTESWSRQILAKHWPDVPIAKDVKDLANDPERLVPDCDILTAGYPCQPFSFAGKRQGEADDRHIWPYIRRIVSFKRPTWCVFENVYGHLSLGLDQVLSDLEGEGYAARTFIVPACGVDAPHRRNRLWIVANTQSQRVEGHRTTGKQEPQSQTKEGLSGRNSAGSRAGNGVSKSRMGRMADGISTWLDEPGDIPRVATGVKQRAARLKGLGNAIVPQIAEQIGLTIKKMESL